MSEDKQRAPWNETRRSDGKKKQDILVDDEQVESFCLCLVSHVLTAFKVEKDDWPRTTIFQNFFIMESS